MSGKPYPEGVTAVVAYLDEIATLEAELGELYEKAKRIETLQEQLNAARVRLDKLLRAMDVDSPGNAGWGARIGWFLGEMRRQTPAASPKDSTP